MHSNVISTNKIMRQVIYALLLGVVANYYYFGYGILIQIVLAIISAIITEWAFLAIRKQPVKFYLSDGSATLTATLLAISIPSIAPWWIIVIGTAFAIIFGKQIYGGLGNNIFNPAMLGYAFLIISYPLQMTLWPDGFLTLPQSIETIFVYADIDGISGATRLDEVKTRLSLGANIGELNIISISQLWINIGFLLGGAYLIARKIVNWQIPLSCLFGIAIMATLLYFVNSQIYAPMYFHLINGGTMLCAFFIATDPVSASTTNTGRIVYGFLIGILIVIIRVFGGYPDGVAFAILILNITVPLIDYYTQPKVFGK